MATIREVADRARVSVATVSRVINQTGYVSADLRERVSHAMHELSFQPSALARGLRRQETRTVGIVVPQVDQPFFGLLTFAIERALFACEYHTFICSVEENQDKEDAYVNMLIRQRVDGIVLVPIGHTSRPNVDRLLDLDIPVVLVDRDLPEADVCRVMTDNEGGGYEGMRYLLSQGHRAIGVISPPSYIEPLNERMRGIRRAAADHGMPYDNPQLEIIGSLAPFEMGYMGARQLLQHAPRPTAIFALTDLMAVGAMHAAAELGLRLPEDLSVVGFDGIPLSSYVIPSLTTVAQPISDLGAAAAQCLLSLIHGESAARQQIRFETRLLVRASTQPIR